MALTDHNVPAQRAPAARLRLYQVVLGALGFGAYVPAVLLLQPYQWNVVTYRAERVADVPIYLPSFLFVWSLLLAPLALAAWASVKRMGSVHVGYVLAPLWPLLLSFPLVFSFLYVDRPGFLLVIAVVLGAGWAGYAALSDAAYLPRAVDREGVTDRRRHWPALVCIVVLVALLTVLHTRDQINFFHHFMLGHADIGHFAEELKNALAGRGLRSDSFPNTRFGWHFTPLLYVLVPGYWLWPSPVYLMVCSALFIHCAAIPVFFLAQRLSGSATVGLLFGLAWLFHPSMGRLVYSGTYGFQWLYVALPLMIWLIHTGVFRQWGRFFLLLVVLFLCRETVVASTLGLGLYWALFTRHRVAGALAALLSLAYGVVCVSLIIPYFAESGAFERMAMFGGLGTRFSEVLSAAFTQPVMFWGRLVRTAGLWFILVILAPMALLPLRSWCFSLAALPALMLILLLDNEQWLSNKFWYQVSVLPIWFGAAVLSIATGRNGDSSTRRGGTGPVHSNDILAMTDGGRCRAVALGWAMVVCAGWGHYLFGFSPISKAYDLYYHNDQLQTPDPRLAVVRHLRDELPQSSTILATERLAAHFTDYRRLYTGKRIRATDYVILDRADTWDASGLLDRLNEFNESSEYRLYGVFESIVVFERDPEAPRAMDED
jgi:uncharacterized membrane protein